MSHNAFSSTGHSPCPGGVWRVHLPAQRPARVIPRRICSREHVSVEFKVGPTREGPPDRGQRLSITSVNTPGRTTAAAFARYAHREVVADSAALQWPGLFVRRYRFPRVVDRFLVPGTSKRVAALLQLFTAHLVERYTDAALEKPDFRGGLPIRQLRKVTEFRSTL